MLGLAPYKGIVDVDHQNGRPGAQGLRLPEDLVDLLLVLCQQTVPHGHGSSSFALMESLLMRSSYCSSHRRTRGLLSARRGVTPSASSSYHTALRLLLPR